MKQLLIILLLASCAKPSLPTTETKSDFKITVIPGNVTCQADVLLSLYIGGVPYGHNADNPCGQHPVQFYNNLQIWDAPLNDTHIKYMGCKLYQGAYGEWMVFLDAGSTELWRYSFVLQDGQMNVAEYYRGKLHRTYKLPVL